MEQFAVHKEIATDETKGIKKQLIRKENNRNNAHNWHYGEKGKQSLFLTGLTLLCAKCS